MNYLKYLVKEIHTTVVATVDDAGLPVTAAIDMMDYDDGGLYFLTAKGKGFYDRLKKRGILALTGTKGTDTIPMNAEIIEASKTAIQAAIRSGGITSQFRIAYIPKGYPTATSTIGNKTCIINARLNHRQRFSVE